MLASVFHIHKAQHNGQMHKYEILFPIARAVETNHHYMMMTEKSKREGTKQNVEKRFTRQLNRIFKKILLDLPLNIPNRSTLEFRTKIKIDYIIF